MPYINKEKRSYFCYIFGITNLKSSFFKELSAGELNFIITQLFLLTEPECYEDFNKLIGVLECVKQEFYRRKVALYENKKAAENGDLDWEND